MNPKKTMDLGAVKDEFAIRWHAGERPTLAEYVEAYPEFHDELVDYVLAFVQLFGTPLEDAEECESEEASQAMLRGIEAGRADARTIAGRLKEISLSKPEFHRRTRFPFDALAMFHRHRIPAPLPFLMRLAESLQLTMSQTQRLLVPQQGSLARRSMRSPQTTEISFGELLDRLGEAGQISQEDFNFWVAEAGRE